MTTEVDALRDEVAILTRKLDTSRAQHGGALSRLAGAQKEISRLRQTSDMIGDAALPDGTPRLLPLVTTERILHTLYASGDPDDAALANQAVGYIQELHAELRRVRPAIERTEVG